MLGTSALPPPSSMPGAPGWVLLHDKLQTSSAMHVYCQHRHEPQGAHSGQQSMCTLHVHVQLAHCILTWLQMAAKYAGTGATGRDLQRVRYLTQVKTRPPTFAAFVSGAAPVTESSRRLLVNALKEDLNFQAVPIRVEVRYRKRRKPKD